MIFLKQYFRILNRYLFPFYFFSAVTFQAQTGTTYRYVSPTGNDSNPGTELLSWKTLAKASTVTSNTTVLIKQGIYNERLVPTHSGTAEGPITFTSYPGDSVTITGVGIKFPAGQSGDKWWSGLIHLENLQHVRISGLKIKNSEASGILATNCSYITIEKNFTENTYSSGIVINGSNNVIVDANEVALGCVGSDQECLSVMTSNIFEIKNNSVHNGLTEGIDIKNGSSNGIVNKNEVYNQGTVDKLPAGIYIDSWDKHEFNIEVFDNISHDNPHGLALSSEYGGLLDRVKIYNNRVYKNRQWGILITGWGDITKKHFYKNLVFYGNIIFENNIGVGINGYTETSVDSCYFQNNLIYHNKSTGIGIGRFDSGNYIMNDVSILNNTIYGNGTLPNDWSDGGINVANINPQSLLIRNNIISSNSSYTICIQPDVPAANVTIDYNLFNGFRNYLNEKAGTNPIYGNPMFVDTLNNDYHLRATSPGIDKGNPDSKYNDQANPTIPGNALLPSLGTVRNDVGTYGGPYTAYWDLTKVAKPLTPSLVIPSNNATGVPTTLLLLWNNSWSATSYQLQVSTDPNFSQFIINQNEVKGSSYSVKGLLNNKLYYWRVSAGNSGGYADWSVTSSFTTAVAVSVKDENNIPTEYSLSQNYPNPFNPTTKIKFGLPENAFTKLIIYDILGREAATLLAKELNAGYHEVEFHSNNFSSGVFFYRLQAESFTQTKKFVLIK